MDEGTKNTSFDHISAGTDPHVLADQTQSISEGLKTVPTQPITGKWASSIARQVKEEEVSRTIKLEDLAKLVSHVQPSFKNLDSPKDDPIINQKHKLELEKNKAKAEGSLLKAQPSFPNVGQLIELLVKSLQTEFLKILSAHDFSNSLPTELKDLSSKLKTLQWELPAEFLSMPTQVEVIQAKLKTLDALPSLLHKVTNSLNQFAQAIASKKTEDDSVPSAGQAGT
ncbi:hypothetical protein Tco_0646913 [Tanacetum coccineum]